MEVMLVEVVDTGRDLKVTNVFLRVQACAGVRVCAG